MRTEDLILVSVDDHVIEPRGMFDGLLPAKYQDEAPKLVRRPDGTDVWFYDGNEIPNVGLNAVVGRPPEEYGIEPMSLDDMRVGCYDVHERVRDMSVNGVLGSMCFPSFPQFCGQLFARREDKDEALAMVRAYNDWHIDRGAAPSPVASSRSPSRSSGTPSSARRRCAGWPRRAATPSPSRRTPRSSAGPPCTTSTGTPSGPPAPTRARSSACTWARPRRSS